MMRRLNSESSDKSEGDEKTPYLDIIAVGTIQFLLSLLIVCYGVFLIQFVLKEHYDPNTGLWTAILFIAASKITSPWTKSYCKHLNNVQHKVHKRNIIITVILLSADLVTASLINTPAVQIILYGFLGGVLSSIIYVHLKFATAEVFSTRPRLFTLLDQIGKPICLIFMSQLFWFLTEMCGTARSQLVLAGLVLMIIPVALLIRTTKYPKMPLSKFQTVDRLSVEMVDFNTKPPIIVEPSSSSDDEDEEEEEDETENKPESVGFEPSTNVQIYYQNVGVKILPNIPEENEIDDDDINEINSKRLSRISAMLQELNENSPKNINLSVNNLYQPDEIAEIVEPEENVYEFEEEPCPKKTRCFSISSSIKFELNMKKRRCKTFMKEHFIRSPIRVLSEIHFFYPSIISSCITTILSTTILATVPYFLYKKSKESNPMTPKEATFILTTMGFTWVFFVTIYPLYAKWSILKMKILFLTGLSLSGLSLYIAHKFSYDNFTLFSLTFGFGHGIVSYAENVAYEDFFGKTTWKKLEDALEITTGYVVILVYLVIYFLNVDVYTVLLSYAYWVYVFNVSLWTFAFLLKRIITQIKNVRRSNRQGFPNFKC
ncbi:hypothetical protein MTP99_012814 [Tenebrio molitor]|nr:hypothetical protein MTP99_012814 [Tenebrio molitor]